jgi:fatty acid elongase 3
MYVYYLSKYYELLDTLLIVLRRAPLRFIHTYHHSVTMLVAFAGSYFCGTGVWYPVGLNCFVHVIMYYYYILVSFGKTPWWKIYVTDIQNFQFYLDLAGYYVWTYQYIFYEWPRGRRCQGDIFYAHCAALALLTFMVMFRNLRNTIAKSKMYKQNEKEKSDKNIEEKKDKSDKKKN